MESKFCRWTWIFIFLCLMVKGNYGTDDNDKVINNNNKLKELLKTLGTYSKSNQQPTSFTTKKPLISSAIVTEQPSSVLVQIPSNSVETSSQKEFPGSSSIKSYQDFYRVFYGTQEGIDHLRSNYGPNRLHEVRARYGGVSKELEDVRKANEHFLKIRTRARCKVPSPRVIRVKDYYPDPSREYLPRCTILHRCEDTTGCCDTDAFHCVPSAMQEVSLHFYKLTVDKNGLGYKGPDNSVEKLLFINHTACHCQPINDLPRLLALDVKNSKTFSSSESPPDGDTELISTTGTHKSTKCRECPVPFTSRVYGDGRCGCDCFDRQKPCIRIKRGREPLPEVERRCVEANYCHIPDCEHGLFDSRSGYCPKRHDEVIRPRQTSSRSGIVRSHRWAFLERD